MRSRSRAARHRSERENASCACFDGRVGARRGERHGARDRDDVHDVRSARRRARLEAGQQAPRSPDAAEVVDAHHLLDEVEVDVEERPAGGHAGVVDEEVDRRVPLEDAVASASTAARSPTSQSSISPPISSASARRRSSRRATSTQCQPVPRSARAVASPIPDDAPVTTATRCTAST